MCVWTMGAPAYRGSAVVGEGRVATGPTNESSQGRSNSLLLLSCGAGR